MMLSGQSHSNKLVSCFENKIKLNFGIHCPKFKLETKRQVKRFDNYSSLYYHLIFKHSGTDKMSQPIRDECIETIQKISNFMLLGILR